MMKGEWRGPPKDPPPEPPDYEPANSIPRVCETCRFWRSVSVSPDRIPDSLIPAGLRHPRGQCRIDAPRGRQSDVSGICYAQWPSTNCDDWCGKWQEKRPLGRRDEKGEEMIMFTPHIQPDQKLVGKLVASNNKTLLGEDMVEVIYGDYLVSAGWYPEGDPEGRYRVDVTRGLESLYEGYFPYVQGAIWAIEQWCRRIKTQPLGTQSGDQT